MPNLFPESRDGRRCFAHRIPVGLFDSIDEIIEVDEFGTNRRIASAQTHGKGCRKYPRHERQTYRTIEVIALLQGQDTCQISITANVRNGSEADSSPARHFWLLAVRCKAVCCASGENP